MAKPVLTLKGLHLFCMPTEEVSSLGTAYGLNNFILLILCFTQQPPSGFHPAHGSKVLALVAVAVQAIDTFKKRSPANTFRGKKNFAGIY